MVRHLDLAYVEDSDLDYRLISRVISPCATVRRWTSAEGALHALTTGDVETERLDGVIVDLRLPGMDGIELVRRVRALPGGSHPAICVLASHEEPGDRDRAAAAGADGFVVKPDNLTALRQLPRTLQRLSAAHQDGF